MYGCVCLCASASACGVWADVLLLVYSSLSAYMNMSERGSRITQRWVMQDDPMMVIVD